MLHQRLVRKLCTLWYIKHWELLNNQCNCQHWPVLWFQVLRMVTVSEVGEKNHTYLDLVKTPQLRKITLCSGFFWYQITLDKVLPDRLFLSWPFCCTYYRFAVSFLYYGISLKISGFGVNIYLTQFIYSVIEVPAKILTYFVLDRIGRRNCQAWFLITTGAMIGINTAIPLGQCISCICIHIHNWTYDISKFASLCCSSYLFFKQFCFWILTWVWSVSLSDYSVIRTCIGVMAKGFSEAAFTTAFLYSAELYPTVLR